MEERKEETIIAGGLWRWFRRLKKFPGWSATDDYIQNISEDVRNRIIERYFLCSYWQGSIKIDGVKLAIKVEFNRKRTGKQPHLYIYIVPERSEVNED